MSDFKSKITLNEHLRSNTFVFADEHFNSVGELKINNGKMSFTGNLDETAKILFDLVAKQFNEFSTPPGWKISPILISDSQLWEVMQKLRTLYPKHPPSKKLVQRIHQTIMETIPNHVK